MKTIKLYNYEINGIVEALADPKSIMNTSDPEKKLPIEILWKMDENLEKLQSIDSRIRKKRGEIEQSYADDEHSYMDTLESGQSVRKIKEEYLREFNAKIMELMQIQNEVEISPIDLNTLQGYSLVPRDYRSIRFMLDKPEEKEDETEKIETVE